MRGNKLKAKVSVVIPNYNGKEFLENCMKSLMLQNVKSFEVIIVDDASKDNSAKDIMKEYPDNGAFPRTKYIFHDENKGFCASVNDGIKASESDYVILLNNDTVVHEDFVYRMYKAITKSENIFSVGAKMVSLANPEIMDDGGDYYCLLGWAFTPAKDKPSKFYNKKNKIFAACGGAAIYRKEIFNQIGYFDENHFAYLEDIDIGYRAGLYGYENVFEPKAIVEHAGSASSGSRYNAFKAKLTAKNNIYLIYKNMPNYQLVINMPFLLLGTLIKLLFYTTKGLGKAYFEGLMDGFILVISPKGRKNRVDFTKLKKGSSIKMEMQLIKNTLRRFVKIM